MKEQEYTGFLETIVKITNCDLAKYHASELGINLPNNNDDFVLAKFTEDDLKNPDTHKKIIGKHITLTKELDHSYDRVHKYNFHDIVVGDIVDVWFNDTSKWLMGKVIIKDADAIDFIKKSKRVPVSLQYKINPVSIGKNLFKKVLTYVDSLTIVSTPRIAGACLGDSKKGEGVLYINNDILNKGDYMEEEKKGDDVVVDETVSTSAATDEVKDAEVEVKSNEASEDDKLDNFADKLATIVFDRVSSLLGSSMGELKELLLKGSVSDEKTTDVTEVIDDSCSSYTGDKNVDMGDSKSFKPNTYDLKPAKNKTKSMTTWEKIKYLAEQESNKQ